MKNMTVKGWGLAIAMLLALPVISIAQGMGQQQGMGNGSGQMGTPPNQAQPAQQTPPSAAPAMDAKEEDAYKKLSSMQTAKPEEVIRNGEAFTKAFPKSNHLETVYSILASAYMQVGDENNMFKYGRLTLQVNPNNVDGLAVMSVATARKIDPDNRPDAVAKEKQVEDWSGRCITSLQSLTKPEGVSDADFARSRDGKLAMCYSGLGQTVLFEGKLGEAVKDLTKATQLEGSTPDPVDLYLLGMALLNNKQYPEAVTAFQQCVKDTDQRMVPLCQEQMGNAKKMGK
ncbi:MAG TPA: tetratricopeptide repeat protein [Candidatus Acidoferrales bacterium]|jgi:tetratricopeptide (TPR) repeat protein